MRVRSCNLLRKHLKMNSLNSDNTLKEEHQDIQLLLPWYVNKSLMEPERQLVEQHLQSCLICSKQLQSLDTLCATVKHNSEIEISTEASFANFKSKMLNRQLEHAKPPLTIVSSSSVDQYTLIVTEQPKKMYCQLKMAFKTINNARIYLAIAASLLLTIILPLTLTSWKLPIINDFYTLSSNELAFSAQNQLHVVFQNNVNEATIDALLVQIHARRLEAPNSAGAYTVLLDKDSQKRDEAIQFLRSQPRVLLVTPIIQP